MIRLLKAVYHAMLKVALRMAGLDYSWYLNFYRKWPHAIPALELALQRFRPASRSRRFFAGYDIERYGGPGDIALDIGANVGDVSSHLLKLGFRVHAFEPDPRCAEFLRRRFSRIGAGRFLLHETAVSNYNGSTTLFFGSITTESSSILHDKPGTEPMGGHEVKVCSITDLLDGAEFAAMIKMDIEGAEYDVLEEMMNPGNVDRFGLCVVETHANKIPGLDARQDQIVSLIDQKGLGDRIRLDWH